MISTYVYAQMHAGYIIVLVELHTVLPDISKGRLW